ncbi:cysteine hydrolase family protein [Prescottella subtropica]|uniref:cysteine hydrolase family protein n=1 Tax=Prescottella subtropica TaxID=2545757 RepID=UPI0010F911D7|nr:isochorismatase family cysteine hydrolase [Prescottella subtropica]
MPDPIASLDEHVRPHLNSSALLVVDMQNDFTETGTLPVAGTANIVPRLRLLLDSYRRAGRPVVHVVRLYTGDDVDRVRRTAIGRGDASIVRPGTAGAEIVDGLFPGGAPRLDTDLLLRGDRQIVGPGESIVWKPRWSAFHRTDLAAYLTGDGVDTAVVAGCNFPNCPRATMFDASNRDFRVVSVTDATSGATPDRLADARSIGVVTMTVADITDSLK